MGVPLSGDEGCASLSACLVFSWKCQVEVPALAPCKALKVSTSSPAQWVVEAQAAIERGAASARADPKESVTQGEVTEAAMKQVGEEAPMPHEAKARVSDEAEAPLVAEAIEGEAKAPRTSKAEAMEARAPWTTKAEVVEAGVGTAKPVAQDMEMEAGQASVLPLVQDPPPSQGGAREVEVHSISFDDTSRGKEVVDAEAASTVEQPALTSGEGSSTLVRELEARSLGKSLFLRWERGVWTSSGSRRTCSPMPTSFWLEKEVSRAAEASVEVQAVLEAEIREHNALQSAARIVCEALERALAIVSSHYAGVDLEAVSDGYVLAKDDEEAEEEVMKLVEAAEAPSMALAKLFKEEVVSPMPTADAGDPKF
ncbi:uncharacterized protein [Miscanthus floridulus]|uniref:uncharacterized protein n=1 Tax=Miscanthus floridulus TaxID=154761 RepID=UPI00345AF8E6